MAIASVAAAGIGAYSSASSAKKQAKGEEARYRNLRKLFGDRQPGMSQLEGLAGLEDFQLNINPADFQDVGFDMTRDAMNFMREDAEITFNQTVGPQNLGQFNQFLSDNLERSNFDFSSLPPEITRTLESSALSRGLGGPAGLAENLSVENKLRLQQQSENSAFRALGFRQGFMPDLINPLGTVFELANFERQNQLGEAGIQLQALSAGADLEMQRFGLEAGYQPPNNAGVNAAANAQTWNAISQSLSTAGMLYGMYGGGGGGAQPQSSTGTVKVASNTTPATYNATNYPNAFPANSAQTPYSPYAYN